MSDASPIPSVRSGVVVLGVCAAAAVVAGAVLALQARQPWFVALGLAFGGVFLGIAYVSAKLVAVVGWLRASEIPSPEFWDEQSVAQVLSRVAVPEAWDEQSVAQVLARAAVPEAWDENSVAQVLKRLGGDTRGIETRLRRSTARDVSALLALYAAVPIEGEVPSPGGWAATPQTLLALVTMVRSLPDGARVVECGSGTSSVWLGLAAKQQNRGIRVVSLDHNEQYFAATADALRRNGIDDVVDLRLAPLEPQVVDGVEFEWYAPSRTADLRDISLLFVDGPPARSGKDARYPAFPYFRTNLVDGAIVVLDDTTRKTEIAIVDKWLQASDGPGALVHERDLDRSSVFRFSLAGAPPPG
ncbi:MAG TPA: class I SAM-dependent methyltransferase [Galbitalea sp.]|jgi:predicted O-methyltransferase YrrM|nr:class I SAM-dependent methyltransferase [Galbitalea sp.]